jgi:hypothetical protein
VHIELAHASPPHVRRFVGEDLLIGLSTHDHHQLGSAIADENIDYVIDDPAGLLTAGSELERSEGSGGMPRFEHRLR